VSFIFSLRETARSIKQDKYWVYFVVAATRIAEMGYIQDLLIVISELQKIVDKEAIHKFLLPLLTGLLAHSDCLAAIRDSTAITRQVEALTTDAALGIKAGEVLAALRDS
jgi:TctA family transporter